jgi:hypothetical protein
MEKECQAIREDCMRIAWSMRGGATYIDLLNMSEGERKIAAGIAKENLEITKKSKMPFF